MGIGSLPKTVTLDGFPTFYQAVIRKRGNKMKEIWKPVVGYEGLYEVSNKGNVRSLDRIIERKDGRKRKYKGKLLSKSINMFGYELVYLYSSNNVKNAKVHRLVAEAFIPNPANLPMVNHIDEIKSNNHYKNLEWCDAKYNMNYGTARERGKKAISIPIVATLENGNEEHYVSLRDAQRKLGLKSISSLSEAVKNGKRFCNRQWRYEK